MIDIIEHEIIFSLPDWITDDKYYYTKKHFYGKHHRYSGQYNYSEEKNYIDDFIWENMKPQYNEICLAPMGSWVKFSLLDNMTIEGLKTELENVIIKAKKEVDMIK